MPQTSVRTARVAEFGGVIASAITGNFALLAFHVAQGNTLSAIGSVIALLGFVAGCLEGFTWPHRRRHCHSQLNRAA